MIYYYYMNDKSIFLFVHTSIFLYEYHVLEFAQQEPKNPYISLSGYRIFILIKKNIFFIFKYKL